jgi:hypothetical protein
MMTAHEGFERFANGVLLAFLNAVAERRKQ